MKKILGILLAVGMLGASIARAIQVNTAAAVIADSNNTAETAVYRDTAGTFITAGAQFSSYITPPQPAIQTIAAGGTIAADACGGVKIITSVGPQTTNTTNTFTSTASVTTLPCVMDLINISTVSITLDSNFSFQTPGSLNLVMTASDTVRVVGLVTYGWTTLGALGAN